MSLTYEKVLKHRKSCKKWGKEFCLDCFGGGLTKYTNELSAELKKRLLDEVIKLNRDELTVDGKFVVFSGDIQDIIRESFDEVLGL